MLRVKATTNIDKFLKSVDEAIAAKKQEMNKVVYRMMLSSFEIILNNTPVDTSQMLQNWHVYKHGGRRGFTPLPDYKARRHDRYDYSGRMAEKASAKNEHMAVLEAELAALNVDFFAEGRHRVTVGLSNATPYGDVLNDGLYNPIPPLVNVTPSGYSIQAPSGIVEVSIMAIQNNISGDMSQFLNIGGSV